MAKVLVITNKIPHYRLPLYEEIGRHFNLTILHEGTATGSVHFHEIITKSKKRGPFIDIAVTVDPDDYAVVVLYANLRLLNLYRMLFFRRKRKYKIILYGVGVVGSYDKRYDSSSTYVWFMKHILRIADAAIFYDSYPTIRYAGVGVDPRKLFVAFNTVEGNGKPILPSSQRTSILFIGSLYLQKGIQVLLDAYKLNIENGIDMPPLNIIGDGPERNAIDEWIRRNNFQNKINLLGSITNEEVLSPYFLKALICVSPGQAGLSVQKAFSYGVPFITTYYPISGGEFSCIIDGVTGFYYDGSVKGLADKMLEVLGKPDLDEIYTNCREFYSRFRSPRVWSKGFVKAVQFAAGESSSN